MSNQYPIQELDLVTYTSIVKFAGHYYLHTRDGTYHLSKPSFNSGWDSTDDIPEYAKVEVLCCLRELFGGM